MLVEIDYKIASIIIIGIIAVIIAIWVSIRGKPKGLMYKDGEFFLKLKNEKQHINAAGRISLKKGKNFKLIENKKEPVLIYDREITKMTSVQEIYDLFKEMIS